jgi:copper chaperone NosL
MILAGSRWVLMAALMLAACSTGAPAPAEIRLGEDACAHCRMTIISLATAAQIVAPGAEPLLFDELGCLRDSVADQPLDPDAMVFVADHRTSEWIEARQATFTRTRAPTPMGSGLLAHASAERRDADPDALHGSPVTVESILQPANRRSTP